MRAAALGRLALVLVAVLVAGCAEMDRRERALKLDQAVNAYVAALRWGEIEQAASHLRARDGTPPAAIERARYRGLNVTGYRIEVVPVGAAEALMTVRFSYFRDDSASVRELVHRGLWWYDEELAGWFLEGELPRF